MCWPLRPPPHNSVKAANRLSIPAHSYAFRLSKKEPLSHLMQVAPVQVLHDHDVAQCVRQLLLPAVNGAVAYPQQRVAAATVDGA